MNDFICIYRTTNSFEANLIKSFLDSEGIDCLLKTNDASGTLPHLGFIQGGTEILISSKDREIGQKLLKEMQDNLSKEEK